MNALDSPIDILVLNYFSYIILTAVNSIWAWVAVITAAVSFCRINALSSPCLSNSEQHGNSQDIALTSSSPPKVATVEAVEPATVSTPTETEQLLSASTTSCCVSESDGGPKGKFSLYYNGCEFVESDDGGEDECSGGGNGDSMMVRGKLGWWCADDWERMMVLRMGHMGWYKCQDLMVLGGSVVRLWDGGRRQAAEMRHHNGCGWWRRWGRVLGVDRHICNV